MNRIRHPGKELAALLAITTLVAGCGVSQQSGADPVSSTPVPSIASASGYILPTAAASNDSRGRRGGSDKGAAAVVGLPADWPSDLPVPPGKITGSTGSAGRWTVLVLAAGSAAQVRQSAVTLYSAAGFVAVSDSVLNKGRRQITLVVENRDHSATQTNLVVGVTTQ